MLKQILKNIRKKPKSVRDNIAMSIAGGFTALVAIIWLYNLPTWYSEIEKKHSNNKEAPGFSDLFGDFKEQFANPKKSETDLVENQVESTTSAIKVELGNENVPPEDWALPEAKDTNRRSPATTTASSIGESSSTSPVTTPAEAEPKTTNNAAPDIPVVKADGGR